MRSSRADLRADFQWVADLAARNAIACRRLDDEHIGFYSPLDPQFVDYEPLEEALAHGKRQFGIAFEVAGGGYGCFQIDYNVAPAAGRTDTAEQLELYLRDEKTRKCLDQAGITYASFVSKTLSGAFESYSDYAFYFGTNRRRGKSREDMVVYLDADAQKLETGLVHVHVSGLPPVPKKRRLPERIWRAATAPFRREQQRSAVIAGIAPLSEEDTWRRFKSDAQGRQPLIFIHGYRTPFGECLTDFALLLNNLDVYRGDTAILPILFAWPGSPKRSGSAQYRTAAALAKRSRRHALRMLEQVVDAGMGATPNLLAHSHGAELLISTMELKRETWGKPNADDALRSKVFNELVLIAPDIDRETFQQAHDEIGNMVRRISVYYNQEDLPLELSDWLRQIGPRLGSDPRDIDTQATDLIDAGHVAQGLKQHSYHMDANEVVYDLGQVLSSMPAAQRGPWLRPQDPKNPASGLWMLTRPASG